MISQDDRDFADWRELAGQYGPDRKAEGLIQRLESFRAAGDVNPVAAITNASRVTDDLCRALDAESPLADIPYVLQDVFDVAAMPTRCGAGFAEPFEYESEQSCQLNHQLELAGAIFLGKMQTTEFGLGLSGDGPVLPPLAHPSPPHRRIAGGASACACVVAHNIVPLAFGLDTLGGVRLSAAHAGLHAFRMAPNQIAADGVFPTVPSLESIGWITGTASNSLALYRALCLDEGLREQLAAWEDSLEDGTATRPNGFFLDNICEPVSRRLKQAIFNTFSKLRLETEPETAQALRRSFRESRNHLRVIASRELYSIHRHWISEYRRQYSTTLARYILKGAGLNLDQIEKAEKFRFALRRQFAGLFEQCDFLVLPTISKVSMSARELHPERIVDIETNLAPASLAGLASAILPLSFEDGSYTGVQIIFHPDKPLLPFQVFEALVDGGGPGGETESAETLPSDFDRD